MDFHPTLSGHDCTAVVLCCMDFRFHKEICKYVTETLGIPDFDLVTEAGGVRYIAEEKKPIIDDLRAELDISFELHHAKTIVLVNHEDCGGYGGKQVFENDDAEFAHHTDHLKKAREILQKEHPGAEILTFFTRFQPDGETIEFAKID